MLWWRVKSKAAPAIFYQYFHRGLGKISIMSSGIRPVLMDRAETKEKSVLLAVTCHLKFNSCVTIERKIQKSLLNWYCRSHLCIFRGQLWWSNVLYHGLGKQPGASHIFLLKLLALHWWKFPSFDKMWFSEFSVISWLKKKLKASPFLTWKITVFIQGWTGITKYRRWLQATIFISGCIV